MTATAEHKEDLAHALWGPLDFDGIRIGAQALDRLLRVAVAFASTDEDYPVLCCVQLRADEGRLIACATDRYAASREIRQVNQRGPGWAFLLRRADATAVRALIKAGMAGVERDDRPLFPADLHIDYAGLNVRVGDLEVHLNSEVEQAEDALLPFPFPAIDRAIDQAVVTDDNPLGPFDKLIDARLLSGLIVAASSGHGAFRIQSGDGSRPIVATPRDVEDELVILITPMRDDGPEPTPPYDPATGEVLA